MIKVENLSKSFGDLKVLKNISLDVNQGETLAIIGPSGSGKSTLLRCLNLLETPEEGYVEIDGINYEATKLTKGKYLEIRRATAMVFQNYNLFANKTIIQNITTALLVVKKSTKDEANKIAIELLNKVGLLDKSDVYPHQLSGGQKQRVAIARALALNPKVILFDEPTSALDPELVQEVLEVIRQIAREKVTIIIVTHEMQFARDVADRVIFMDEGSIIETGNAHDLLTNPTKPRTRQFLSKYLKL